MRPSFFERTKTEEKFGCKVSVTCVFERQVAHIYACHLEPFKLHGKFGGIEWGV